MNGTYNTDLTLEEKCERFSKIVSENIRNKRQALNLTQEELAEQVGMSAESIGKLETQKQWFSLESLISVAEALKTTPCQLFLDKERDHLIPVAEVQSLADRYQHNTPADLGKTYRISNVNRE